MENKVGIAFGGGATRGFASIGLLKALYENDIYFDYVAGTSVGSIIGVLYSSKYPIDKLIETAKRVTMKDFLKYRKGLLQYDPKSIKEFIISLIGDITFDDLDIPFRCVAVDLKAGSTHIFKEGNLSDAIMASCAVPGVFSAVMTDNHCYVDGGVMNSVPANVVKDMGANKVVSINLNSDRRKNYQHKGFINTLRASIQLSMSMNAHIGLSNSDVIIEPDLEGYKLYKTQHFQEMFEIGYNEALKKMPEIKSLFNR